MENRLANRSGRFSTSVTSLQAHQLSFFSASFLLSYRCISSFVVPNFLLGDYSSLMLFMTCLTIITRFLVLRKSKEKTKEINKKHPYTELFINKKRA